MGAYKWASGVAGMWAYVLVGKWASGVAWGGHGMGDMVVGAGRGVTQGHREPGGGGLRVCGGLLGC